MTKKPQTQHGFELVQSQEIKELNATYHRYLHKKSGAELIHLACDDNNKAFNIAFKTIPEDDTGCPHIMEHSVLNGSQNYPAKGTFMELIKGSLNTFINAMTSSDWTSYPVASTNDKDFLNLMKVYLDAVLRPRIYDEPMIMDQEGWHYELFQEDDEIKYKGVVYNEMKGAFSSVDSIVNRFCQHTQFPDTPYGFESGGDPDAIPELTHEKFLAFHQKYYHPSNSKIWLYGDMDIQACLKLIDNEYLTEFDDPGIRLEFPAQKPFPQPKMLKHQYPLADDKDPKGQYYLALNYTYGKVTDKALTSQASLLTELLMLTPASPLKAVIRESGLCKDSQISIMNDILQPTISIVCKQVKKENLETLSKLIKTEMQRIVKAGFEKKLIEALINSKEFFLREAQMQGFPKGLFYNLYCFGMWNHGGDPLDMLAFEGYLAHLRKGLDAPVYEELLDTFCLSNPHASEIHFEPVPGLIAKQDEQIRARLAEYKKTLSKEQIQDLIRYNEKLKIWQEEPDSEEDLLKIPLLSLDDVDPKAASMPCEEEPHEEYTLLKHPLQTNGILYLKVYFDLTHANQMNLPWLKLYTQLLGQLNTQNYSYGDLENEIRNSTGGIKLGIDVFNSYQTPDEIIPKMILTGKAVADKIPQLMDLTAEYALRPVFDNPSRLKSLIREIKASTEEFVIMRGVTVAINRMFAPFSQLHSWKDKIVGLDYLHFLCELESKMDEDIEHIIGELKWVQEHFFTIQKAIISLTADEELLPKAISNLPILSEKISKASFEPVPHGFETRVVNEGISAPVKIQYVVKGGNYFRKGYPYSGRLRVLSNILSNEYIYKELRVKGGAYGGGAGFTLDGYQFFYSYRDPNLRETLEVYDKVPDFIRSFKCSKREMDKYILGDISQQDYPKTPEATGLQSDMDYLTGFTQEDRQQIREEVLACKLEDLRVYADMIQALMDQNQYAIFGNEANIRAAADLFDEITPVFKK
ncbi:MAG: insulinase family protein [Candidatus Cloacimonadaceae bacterium]|jgi:Zn-dependent M16 (insulinase) family peptidase|nr:insulinase family protein [Candidatus Cloacimonadota bacterium]MCK9178015.1 insulinase family protein [Candidatus Cloacimonadota bacterium]MDD3103017.1 insulinase family protein [Candidatus Cloacimonadota bacterium]MDD3533062.1 insulinase family protein [Candidatus Cloacimonadota bacterium]MDY0127693.1 insulinase family protein [Candidatus Cloacimonadaceae bacterium]